MTQKFQGASGQSNKILPQCSGVPRSSDPKSNKILPIARTSSSSFPWAVKNSQAQSHAQAQAEDAGSSTGTPVIIYDESRTSNPGTRSAHKVIIYDESRSGAAGPGSYKVIIYDPFLFADPGLF
jgi:hypothetical protein